MNVNIFVPCFVDQFFPEVAFKAIKILEKAGCKVHYNTNQTCCGQPAFNAGFWDESRKVAEKCILDLSNNYPTIVLGSSCTGMIKNYYAEMFHNSSLHNQWKSVQKQTYEFTDFLVNVLKKVEFDAKFDGLITYHDACSALRECGIAKEPRLLLSHVNGLSFHELPERTTCCGFGGTFAVKYASISVAMAEQKVQHALSTGASHIVSADLSCLMHLKAYIDKQKLPIQVIHIAEILASGW